MSQYFFDHPILSERYFFPRSDRPANPTWVSSAEVRLCCWEERRHPGAPTLVHFHGNGEVVADYIPELSDAFAAMGINTFFAEFRGYGGSTGQASMIAMLDDVDAIFAAASVESGPLFVYGRSVGSIYAIERAKRHPEVRGLVIESGIAAPLERALMRIEPREIGASLADLEKEATEHLDHRVKVQTYGGPVLVMHARNDSLVSCDNAERLAVWAGERADLHLFPQGDHNTMLDVNGTAILTTLGRFVASLAG
ncbi:MAG: hypothetical protein A2289_25300 [Deltaproteobacteria bacterium RIFOXYA12_FULL_58_15]|nr:MAG: hypothetical protein A2289_25300 [Deltaproteobacteria bacterium RIFOXYA12_FULL_58_15]OGR08637.1 MAG: hypothetical protein A2341_14520 [Deltaproteobacteria bacterium RIFOXYB12_FULL_58_9]